MGYRYLEDWTFADVAFEVKEKSIEELFRYALDATMNVMVADLGSIEPNERRHERLEAPTEADLLHEFLQRALYYKDADQLLLRAGRISIRRMPGKCRLECEFRGETLDPRKHEPIVDVKAVTHHRFQVRRDDGNWLATAVLDV